MAYRRGVDDTISIPASAASAGHIDTWGVHFPRRTSDAGPLLIPVASRMSLSFTVWSFGRMSRRKISGRNSRRGRPGPIRQVPACGRRWRRPAGL
jgi:hypothetical protein